MGKRSNEIHRALVFLAHLQQYKELGPLIGPKEIHQPDYRWSNEMQKFECDKCGDDVKPENVYALTMRDYEADLCINCAGEVQTFIESGVSQS